MVEYFSTDSQNQAFIPITSQLHLEHVLPQEPKEYSWDKIFQKEEIDKWTNSLANLTLLSMRKNIQALNYDFEKKKEAYQNCDNVISSFVVTQDIINEQKWDIEILEKREKIVT